MITYYDITENEMKAKSFEAGAMYFCSDTGKIFVDSEKDNERKPMSNNAIILSTEAARTSILAPIPDKLYCVIESGRLYMYTSSGWKFMGNSNFELPNVTVEKGTATISDSRILAVHNGQFIPDPSVADLVTTNTCSCAAGKVTITIDYTAHPIPGRVIIS